MNIILISILVLTTLLLPSIKCSAEEQETPLALPLAPQTEPTTIVNKEKSGNEIWQEDDREVLIRNIRGTHNIGEDTGTSCRYVKSPWAECNTKTNTRTRTLTLKKGETGCVPIRTIQKKCKKACRYEKGSWTECLSGQMTRTDKLKPTSDPFCQTTRVINKNCNQGKFQEKSSKEKKVKNKGALKSYAME